MLTTSSSEGVENVFTVYVIVTAVVIVANLGSAAADFRRAGFVRANSAKVGVPAPWIPWLGLLKAAGAAGLLLGLLGFRFIGLAAAGGLVLFFVGAVIVHIRARVYHNIGLPGILLGLAIVTLTLAAEASR
jgi:hypothetical protein